MTQPVVSEGYDEQTLVFIPLANINIRPLTEVYGQDGYGWYATVSDAQEIMRALKSRTQPRHSKNPLFANMPGVTQTRLKRLGFIQTGDTL